jgi:hydroxyacylglutathione hydrolase
MFVVQSFTFSPIAENTYVLYNEKKQALVVDPGCYFEEERAVLKNFVESNALEIKYLLNTHCHLDHVFGNRFVYETWELILHAHALEKPVLDYAPTAGLMWNLPFDQYNGPVRELKEGDIISVGSDRLECLFMPGHSPGSLGFYCREQGFVVSGDVLFRESIGRTDLPGGDHETLLRSIRTQLFTLPDETIIYSGHGEPTTIGHEKKYNPFLR